MKAVYRIETETDAPRLTLVEPTPELEGLLHFNGRPKLDLWPTEPPPDVRVGEMPESPYMFYFLAPGALVVRQDVLETCEDFYWVTQDGCEPLPLRSGDVRFEVIHPVNILPSGRGGPPCPIDRYCSALFRIEGFAEQVFCAEGVSGVPLNEFKQVYEEFGFSGLRFIEIWRGEE